MITPTLDIETVLWQKGFKYICGMDEVGRGSWAGPLVVAGVVLSKDFKIPQGLRDSKLATPKLREKLSEIIINSAHAYSIVEIKPALIDKLGLTRATNIAFRKVLRTIKPVPDYCLIDAFYIRHVSRKKQQAVKNGDKICASISAASIIAKVYRDNLMKRLHDRFPAYGFDHHMGYGTKKHQEAIIKNGLLKIHRKSYNLDFLYT